MPDTELFTLAKAGKLGETATLTAQVKRMLADPKAEALTDNFAGQWLYTRALVEHEPDYNFFPEWTEGGDALRTAMEQETRLFFQEFLSRGWPIEQMLTADHSFLNQRLAQHYGATGPTGSTPERMTLPAGERRGLLGQGSVLTITSYPTRTSPVKRGRWVLAQLLCDKPNDPPPGVEGNLPTTPPQGTSLRELLEQHRANPDCAICHDAMDPIGLALENFDAIGRWRTEDSGVTIDPTGKLPGDIEVEGPADLSQKIAADARYPACILTQMFTYALGRGPTEGDDPYFDEMLDNLGGSGFSLEQAILQIVLSEPFRMKRGGK
jgi:hypothetical protein